MRRLNKKGTFFNILLVIVTLIVLIQALIVLSNKKTQFHSIVGEKQFDLVELYQEAEKALLYIDQSASYSTYKAIHDLAENGAQAPELTCGTYLEYNLWQNESKDCWPTKASLKKSFGIFINRNLDEYIKNYPNKEVIIPLNNYDFVFEDALEIDGIATIPMQLHKDCTIGAFKASIKTGFVSNKGNKILCARYSTKPSFTTSIDYDLFSAYENYIDQAKSSLENIRECLAHGSWINTDSNDLEDTCKLSGGDIVKEAKDEEGKFTIAFEINDKLPDKIPTKKDITLKFAVTQKDDIPPPKVSQLKIEKKDKSLSLQWKRNEASDTVKYNIYCSTKNFDNIEDMTPSKVSHKTQDQTVKESISSCNGKALNTTTYYIAVTAVDEADNELKEVSTKSYAFS